MKYIFSLLMPFILFFNFISGIGFSQETDPGWIPPHIRDTVTIKVYGAKPFLSFYGTATSEAQWEAGTLQNIVQHNGDGAVVGPQAPDAAPGWAWAGAIRIAVNGDTNAWLMFYTYEES